MPVIRGRCPFTRDALEIVTDGPTITAIRRGICDDASLPLVSPGFVDIQVNGFAGHDVNGEDADPEAIIAITAELARRGVSRWVPTVITASTEQICASIAAVSTARTQDPATARAVPHVHVEGPFLSDQDGPRGAHDIDQVRPVDAAEVAAWRRHGPVGRVTVSPHWDQASQQIAAIVAMGVTVAIGHTHATPQQIAAAVDAGASQSTHLGNGIHAELPRHPNPIWSQLADPRLTAGFIGDGHHLDPDTLTAMIRAKGVDKSVLISDSAALAGSPPGIYTTPVGGTVELTQDGRLSLPGTTLLAGSGVCLSDVVRWVVRHTSLPLADIITMAAVTPAHLIDPHHTGHLRVGAVADLNLVDESGQLVQIVNHGKVLS